MPLNAGSADKIGNRFELRWTAWCLTELLDGLAQEIKIEPPGDEGEGIEFILMRGTKRELHQVKRQMTKGAGWTIRSLRANEVLENAEKRLRSNGDEFHFVSTMSAPAISEIGENARTVPDLATFRSQFLRGKQRQDNWADLKDAWKNSNEQDCFDCARRLRIETISEDLLRKHVIARVSAIVDGNPEQVADSLMVFVLDSINRTITADDVWANLETKGYSPRMWAGNGHILGAIRAINEQFFSSHQQEFFREPLIHRPLADEIDAAVKSVQPRYFLVTGDAGGGKSGLLTEFIANLKSERVPYLALRLDRIEAGLILTSQLGERLGLPGSPASILGAVAKDRRSVLIIDQLDAISLISGKNPDLFDCIFTLFQEAGAFPEMRIVAACRAFDLENDHRMKKLVTDGTFTEKRLQPLSSDRVLQAVAEIGFDSKSLSQKQIDLLSNPLNLAILSRIKPNSEEQPMVCQTTTDLFELFWNRKRLECERRGVSATKFSEVIDLLCGEMEKRGVLFVLEPMLDTCRDVADRLASEHVFTSTGGKWSFFHEGFYDFANARRLYRLSCSIVDYLKPRGQGLELRTQLRQSLAYRRNVESSVYCNDLKSILSDPEVRFHLKAATVAHLNGVSNATVEEASIVIELIEVDPRNDLTRELFDLIGLQPSWFRLILQDGSISRWLRRDDAEFANLVDRVLAMGERHEPGAVAELLSNLYKTDTASLRRTAGILGRCEISHPSIISLFLDLVTEGAFDADGPSSGSLRWSFLYALSEKNPTAACEVIGAAFHKSWKLVREQGGSDPFSESSSLIAAGFLDDQFIARIYKGAPLKFLNETWDTFANVVKFNLDHSKPAPFPDAIWRRRSGSGWRLQDRFFDAIEQGLRALAIEDFGAFQKIVADVEVLESITLEYLLLSGFSSAARDHPDEALSFILAKPVRIGGRWSYAPGVPTKGLIEQASKSCSDALLMQLQSTLLTFYPDFEKHSTNRNSFGLTQYRLLSAIQETRRSSEVTKRLKELTRKFGATALETVEQSITGGLIPSPLPDKAIPLMTDEQWLSAIERHHGDSTRFAGDGSITGGATIISNQLQQSAQKEPVRFLRLLKRIPTSANPVYFNAILMGAAGTQVPIDVVMAGCEIAHKIENQPCGEAICYCLERFAQAELPAEAIRMVCEYAGPAQPDHLRRSALMSLGNIFFANRDRIPIGIDCLRICANAVSSDVRTFFSYALTPLFGTPFQSEALNLFLQMWESEPHLEADPIVERFLHFAGPRDFARMKEVFVALLESDNSEMQLISARQVAVAALGYSDARGLANQLANGNKEHRQGLAEVCARNLRDVGFAEFCENHLARLFYDESDDVRASAAECFKEFTGEELAAFNNLISRFLESPAVEKYSGPLFEALARSTIRHDAVTLRACEKALAHARSNPASGHDLDLMKARDLALRTYYQAEDDAVREQSLDLIDQMIAVRIHGLDQALQELESRR